jgi:hypothetical protein
VTFRIEFTDVAEMEVQDSLWWLLSRFPEYAGRWQAGLEKAVNSLTEFPGDARPHLKAPLSM